MAEENKPDDKKDEKKPEVKADPKTQVMKDAAATEKVETTKGVLVRHEKAKDVDYLLNVSKTVQSVPDLEGHYRMVPANHAIHKSLVQAGVANKSPWLIAHNGKDPRVPHVHDHEVPGTGVAAPTVAGQATFPRSAQQAAQPTRR